MKNLKFFGIVMMLVMGMSFASCSSDDDEGPSSGSIKENLEGEWFLVNAKWECSDDGNETVIWDYDDQTAEGVCSEGCAGHDPEKMYIECVGENRYDFTWYYYYGSRWYEDESEIYEIEGNVISEYTGEYDGDVYSEKVYIKSISAIELVVVDEEYEVCEDGSTHKDVITYTYRRNN